MPRFRAPTLDRFSAGPSAPLAVGLLIDNVMQPGNFFAATDLCLAWIAARSETILWEIFRGRLLDAAQTRRQRTFLSWHVQQVDAEPMLSVKLDVHDRQIHVTRGLLSYAWEAYDAEGGIGSREVVKWTRELVGTLTLAEFDDLDALRDELICLIWQALVGTSRLPLTSVEAPLPAFTFGQLHYCYWVEAEQTPITSWQKYLGVGLEQGLGWPETVKLIEFALRTVKSEDLARLVNVVSADRQVHHYPLTSLFRALFNHVSLSPVTSFVETTLTWIKSFVGTGLFGTLDWTDFLSHLLRQLGRHLTAYDLVTFHHRGANYPDALLLDAVLKRYLQAIEQSPEHFSGDEPTARVRRRALRQGCLLRRHYEGHPVPDLPTSPGENARVLPASHPRVPEEQLLQSNRRRRQLFADDPLLDLLTPLARAVLAQSVRDLEGIDERTEMGLGVFIDRPLGYAKQIGEADLTPLLAHEAFSLSIARRRWRELKKLCEDMAIACPVEIDALFESGPCPAGLPHTELAECPRPTAALADVRKVAEDFVILRTKPIGLLDMLRHFRLIESLGERYRLPFLEQPPRLCVQTGVDAQYPTLALYDDRLRRRVEMQIDASEGYITRAGVELPKAGLRILTVWEGTDDPEALRRHDVDGLRAKPPNEPRDA